MYYRRKILLSLLNLFGGKLQYTRLQKYLFLLTKMQEEPVYDFVPYKYGPFSFQSYADVRALIKRDFLTRSVRVNVNKTPNYYSELSGQDQNNLGTIKSKFAQLSYTDLIKFTYMNYPEYAINSEIIDDYSSNNEVLKIRKQPPSQTDSFLYTVGYEGISIDFFINKLLQNNIRLVIDVRKNPVSMKYGFSKSQLIRLLGRFNIEYNHMPQLGIDSARRSELKTVNDYEQLFEEYGKNILPQKLNSLISIQKMLQDNRRITLMCFESEPQMCHRHKITEWLENSPGWQVPIRHV